MPRPPAPFTTAMRTAPGLLVAFPAEQQGAQLRDGRLAAGEVPDVRRKLRGARNGRRGSWSAAAAAAAAAAAEAGGGDRAGPGSTMVPIAMEPGESARGPAAPAPPSASIRRPPASDVARRRTAAAARIAAVTASPRSRRLAPAGCGGRPARGLVLGGADAGHGRRRRIRREQLRVQPPQLAPRLHAELVGDHLARLGVRLERLGPAARLLERAHQQRPEPFPQRVLRHQAAQLRYHLGRPAAGDVRLDAQLGRVEPRSAARLAWLASSGDGGTSASSGPRHSPSASASNSAARSGSRGGQRGPALGDKRLEHLAVQVPRRDAEQVAGRAVDERLALGVADDLFAQPVHVDADHVVGRAWRVIAPQLEDQALGRDELAGTHEQAGEQRPPLGRADCRPAVWAPHLKVPQDAESHQVPPSERTLSSASG